MYVFLNPILQVDCLAIISNSDNNRFVNVDAVLNFSLHQPIHFSFFISRVQRHQPGKYKNFDYDLNMDFYKKYINLSLGAPYFPKFQMVKCKLHLVKVFFLFQSLFK